MPLAPSPPKYYFIGIINILYETIIEKERRISWCSVMSCLAVISITLTVLLIVSNTPKVKRVLGYHGILILSVLSMLMLLIPMDVPWQMNVLSQWMKPLVNLMRLHITESLRINDLLIIIWGAGIVFFLFLYLISGVRLQLLIRNLPMKEAHLDKSLKALLPKKTKVRICYGISVPVSIRGLEKVILLPARSYSDKEISHIILHEAAHLRSGDHLIITLCDILCIIYWWNPVIRLLRKNLEKNLEIRCDASSVRDMTREEKADYMNTLLNVFRGRNDGLNRGLGFLGGKHSSHGELKERFLTIESELKSNKKPIPLWIHVIAVCGMGALILLSYSFAFSPLYLPGEYESDIISPDGKYVNIESAYNYDATIDSILVVNSESYIINHGDGEYTVMNIYGEQNVSDKWVEILSESGIEVVTTQ